MSDVASQSRSGLKENNRSTGSSQLEGSTNGDPPAVEPPSSNATPPPLSNSSAISANKKAGTAAKKKTLDPTEVRAIKPRGRLEQDKGLTGRLCALPTLVAAV